MKSSDKPLHVSSLAGRKICAVCSPDHWTAEPKEGFTIEGRIPPSKNMPTFDVTIKRGKKILESWLVLDPYGIEDFKDSIPPSIMKSLGLDDPLTIAINKVTGDIKVARFFDNKKTLTMTLTSMHTDDDTTWRVPARHLEDLALLRSLKRPFFLSITKEALLRFIEQEVGYEALRDAITVNLFLNGKSKPAVEIEGY